MTEQGSMNKTGRYDHGDTDYRIANQAKIRLISLPNGKYGSGSYDFRSDGVNGDPVSLCEALRKAVEGET